MAYTPAKKVFNGSILTFNGDPIAAIEDIEWTVNGEKVDIGSALDALMTFGGGIPNVVVGCGVKGVTSLAYGDIGDLSVNFNDNGPSPDSLAMAFVSSVAVSGSKNQPIVSKIEFVPAPEDDAG
jgi:hypothetical protein